MSRLARYKDSLTRFIKDRSCLRTNVILADIAYDYIQQTDLILPILVLTIMNNQKRKMTLQGYHAASCIAFMQTACLLIETNQVNKLGPVKYSQLLTYLISSAQMSVAQNIESIRSQIKDDEVVQIFLTMSDKLFSVTNLLLSDIKLEPSTSELKGDVLRWFTKIKVAYTAKLIDKASLIKHIESRITPICELAFVSGWIAGCGDVTMVDKICKAAEHFSYIYQIAADLNCMADINKITPTNYVVTHGFQKAYETFMEHKQKFLAGVMTTDIYTSTVREIVGQLEITVDFVLENSSPDLASISTN